MAFRLLISDAVWAEVELVLRELKHAAGIPGPHLGALGVRWSFVNVAQVEKRK